MGNIAILAMLDSALFGIKILLKLTSAYFVRDGKL
tara:strand:- start:854 stop:958 length:105 start_codon:yes stop_codon:yes gene_type:complete